MSDNVTTAGLYRYAMQYWWRFFKAAVSSHGIVSKSGRALIIGKCRRIVIAAIPGLTEKLQKKYGLTGGCAQCGASCNLLFSCPAWDAKTGLCGVYEHRPKVCRVFPITPADIAERDLMNNGKSCGFTFSTLKKVA